MVRIVIRFTLGKYKNKSDISYLKTSQAYAVLIHSSNPNSVGQRLCRHHEYLAACFWHFHSRDRSASTLPLLLDIHLEVVTVAIYAKQPKTTKVRSHGNNVQCSKQSEYILLFKILHHLCLKK